MQEMFCDIEKIILCKVLPEHISEISSDLS